MIITKPDFLTRAKLSHETLEVWIEEEWLIPSRTEDGVAFSEADLARARLIRDLTDDLGVNAEGVSVALHLLDQIYGLRRAMAEMLEFEAPAIRPVGAASDTRFFPFFEIPAGLIESGKRVHRIGCAIPEVSESTHAAQAFAACISASGASRRPRRRPDILIVRQPTCGTPHRRSHPPQIQGRLRFR